MNNEQKAAYDLGFIYGKNNDCSCSFMGDGDNGEIKKAFEDGWQDGNKQAPKFGDLKNAIPDSHLRRR